MRFRIASHHLIVNLPFSRVPFRLVPFVIIEAPKTNYFCYFESFGNLSKFIMRMNLVKPCDKSDCKQPLESSLSNRMPNRFDECKQFLGQFSQGKCPFRTSMHRLETYLSFL